MKKIYKLLAGVVVMLIAVTDLQAHGSAPFPQSGNNPKYVLYPPTNFQISTIVSCYAYLTWDKPQIPGGSTPAGLLGYRIYRDGVLVHYNSSPDSLDYYDNIDEVGLFTDSVTAYYDLASYGYPGQYGESVAVSGNVVITCGLPIPFWEPWDMGSFAFQGWTLVPSPGNWTMNTSQGNPIPTAAFSGTPQITNYNHLLKSIHLICDNWTCANIYLEYDTRSIIMNPTSQEILSTELFYDNSWHPIDSIVNNISTGWIHHKIDITAVAGQNPRIGFRAKGINSSNIGEWDVDNIHLYSVCFKPPDFTLNRTGNIVHLSWGTPCTGKKTIQGQPDSSSLIGYNLYRTNETGNPPFVKINASLISDTEYYDHLPLINGNFCYYVTARYIDSFNPPSTLCEPHSDTLCIEYTAGITEQNETRVRIYPNPVGDIMNIETGQGFTGIELLNFLGEKMHSESFPATKHFSIAMKDLPPGIYLVKINLRDEIVTRKIIKK